MSNISYDNDWFKQEGIIGYLCFLNLMPFPTLIAYLGSVSEQCYIQLTVLLRTKFRGPRSQGSFPVCPT